MLSSSVVSKSPRIAATRPLGALDFDHMQTIFIEGKVGPREKLGAVCEWDANIAAWVE